MGKKFHGEPQGKKAQKGLPNVFLRRKGKTDFPAFEPLRELIGTLGYSDHFGRFVDPGETEGKLFGVKETIKN